ncbi:MAG: GIY-YIG nuclease family protein [Candidatus Gracilibacteria bacterium]|nr:GIY-YIG nuclease family protein [Candidatus Gracilibacteria bacterium]
MTEKIFAVYILSNKNRSVLYTGVTSNLPKRIYEHKHKITPGFTSRFNCSELMYYEVCDNPESAIMREKQIKAGSREKKVMLIDSMNPTWKDLYESIVG